MHKNWVQTGRLDLTGPECSALQYRQQAHKGSCGRTLSHVLLRKLVCACLYARYDGAVTACRPSVFLLPADCVGMVNSCCAKARTPWEHSDAD